MLITNHKLISNHNMLSNLLMIATIDYNVNITISDTRQVISNTQSARAVYERVLTDLCNQTIID